MAVIQEKMQVEIWSDIACPFCYIGKRNFETALMQFPHKEEIEVVWRSFQLVPDAKYIPGRDPYEALAKHLHTTVDHAKMMNKQVTTMAKEAGITFNMDKVVWANTFDAQRVIQYAKTVNLANELEEGLFRAHFTDGKNVEDHTTLIQIAEEAGLSGKAVKEILAGDAYATEVRNDIAEAQNLGVRGIPTYILSRKASFSGAVPVANITSMLHTSFSNWKKEHASVENIQGATCTPEGECK